jgi:glycerol-3-phosphate acyltransferase PlsX
MSTIAIDVMGGDHGVAAAVSAAASISLDQEVGVLLVGDQGQIDPVLRRSRYDAGYLTVHHTPYSIGMDESPKDALKAKPDASIALGAKLVAQGSADALVSAGNTGGCILACAQHFRRLEGVPRTALAAVFPTERRRGEKDDPFSLILDVGATLEASAETLVAFAKMGSAYAACISKNSNPRVALLSNGAEPYKGRPAIVKAHQILSQEDNINFIGNVEGVDLPRGTADVVVTDGFTGNVVLKMLEGMSETVVDLAKYAYRSRVTWRAGLWMLSGGLKQLKDLTDWQQYGGAPILGFDHLVIKAHGKSSARAIRNAIKVAAKGSRSNLCGRIQELVEGQKSI